MNSTTPSKVRHFGAILAIAMGTGLVLITAAHFPYYVDKPFSAEEVEKTRKHWADMYSEDNALKEHVASVYDKKFSELDAQIKSEVSEFASRYGLEKAAVLDIGSGSGYLQDVVENYTGLDIASTAAHNYHKKFVLGSATAMPFADDSFDAGWSIFVFEHVPNPEQGLVEIRRVMKSNAILYLKPAWNCTTWAAAGYDLRPYSDFDWKGRLIKASIPVRASVPFSSSDASAGSHTEECCIVDRPHSAPLQAPAAELSGLLGAGQRCAELH